MLNSPTICQNFVAKALHPCDNNSLMHISFILWMIYMITKKTDGIFWHWMAMIFFRLRRKLVKIKFFLKVQNRFFSHMQLGSSWLLTILFWSSNSAWETKISLGKNLKLTLIMFLGYTAHSIWDSSHKQIGRTQTKEKKKKKGQKRYLKFQVENYEISVCLSKFICVSVCVFGLDNMRLIYKWALFKFRFTWTEKYSILNI